MVCFSGPPDNNHHKVSYISYLSGLCHSLLEASDNLLTIFHRTIVNGLTYLATFIFGLNSLGLFLYSGQLAIKSFMGDSTAKETESKSTDQSSLSNSSVESPSNNTELSSRKKEQSSNDTQ